MKEKITPRKIVKLKDNEIFVFGSNLEGGHYGGAAFQALTWGAVIGHGVGLQGNTYAIPTMFNDVCFIKPFVDKFIDFAEHNLQLIFYVTEIGCGIAGWKPEQIAPFFEKGVQFDQHIFTSFIY